MDDFSQQQSADSVRQPIFNLQVRGAEYYRLLHQLKDLEDFDVIFYLLHKLSPDKRTRFDNAVVTKVWRNGALLMENNFPFDYQYVENTQLLSRQPSDISRLVSLIANDMSRFNSVPVYQSIKINGVDYTCIGRDHGSAKLLYSVLACSVSDDQIAHLKQDLISNGMLSKILLDPDFEQKFKDSVGPFFQKVLHFVDFFKVYFNDLILQFSSALLLFEHEITEEILSIFLNPSVSDLRSLALAELDVESVFPVRRKNNKDLTHNYHDGLTHLDPWLLLPGFDQVVQPLVNSKTLFKDQTNALIVGFQSTVNLLLAPENELLGTSVLAACTDFSHDYLLRSVQEAAIVMKKKTGEKADVFVVGSNRRTPFQFLTEHDTRQHIFRNDNTFYDLIRPDKSHVVVYNNVRVFLSTMLDSAQTSVIVFDTVSYKLVRTRTNNYRMCVPLDVGGSFVRCFQSIRSFFGKLKNRSPDDHHRDLPVIIVARFTPDFSESSEFARDVLNNLVHHYDIRYVPPSNFHGLEFGIYMFKHDKMRPKFHGMAQSPYHTLQSFVFHTLSLRHIVISGIIQHRFSWKCLSPMRMLSRYYGLGSKVSLKVQDLVNFSDWGGSHQINDFNNLFTDYVSPEVFSSTPLHFYKTNIPISRKKKKNANDVGKSILCSKNENAIAFLDRVKSVQYGIPSANVTGNSRSPAFKKERAARNAEGFQL